MRRRRVAAVFLGVVAAHGLAMFGPFQLWQPAQRLTPPAPTHLQSAWVTLPPLVAPPAPAPLPPAPLPAPARPAAKKAVAPRPAPAPLPAVAASAPPVAVEPVKTDSIATTESAPAETITPSAATASTAGAQAEAEAAPALPAGPRMQVQTPSGEVLALALPVDGSALQQSVDLRFQVQGFVKGMQYHASAQLQWHTEGNSYQARQSISAFLLGSLEQTSTGRITPQGLQPLEFVDRRLAKIRSVHLDWPAQQARFTPERAAAAIGPGTQDRLSVFMQLAAMLQALPTLRTPGTRLEIPTLGARRMQTWTFVVEAEETLDLPAGSWPTLRLHRQPQPGEDETAQLWLAPALGYAPVRIHLQEANGDVMTLALKS